MDYFLLWLIFVFLAGGLAVHLDKQLRKRKRENAKINVASRLPSRKDFSTPINLSHDVLADLNGEKGLTVDEKQRKVCIISASKDSAALRRIISYRDLLSSEIMENGQTVTKTSRTSQLGGALIGGLAFGGAGAFVGALSGATTSAEKVSKIELIITINDVRDPLHSFTLMDTGIRVSKMNDEYKTAMNEVKRWHGVIQVLIKQADREDAEKETSIKKTAGHVSASIADEIEKLDRLRKKNLLTDEEFCKLKAKLLG